MSKLYINRQIRLGDEVITEAQLLQRSSLIIVLAEPGAGKSDLLGYLAALLNTKSVRASRFRTAAYVPIKGPLVIDAMDEVARVGENQLNDIVEKARANHKGTVIFASRSGEWEKARTNFVEDCFGKQPDIARLEAFSEEEQKRLFEDRFPKEYFERFTAEVHRFDLSPLLGNPEFFQLFGFAYQESKGRFSSKVQIYTDAARRLAHESNTDRSTRGKLDVSAIVKQAGTVFVRLLLSGASGVSLREKIDDRNYPYVEIVAKELNGGFAGLLDSRLLKPSSDENEHEPVHRVVAEYLAAQYLAERMGDPGDRISVKRCLAIIAPNCVVRDELRGLLGWLAALGGDEVQKASIAIDPYAVLANGDPAQLLPHNKLLLIERLQKITEVDPYFRRSDEWRSFNVGQFFSEEIVHALRPLLASREETHLRGLIMELIAGTSAVENLHPDLVTLTLDARAKKYERLLAIKLLMSLDNLDISPITRPLLDECSPASLEILTRVVNERGTTELSPGYVIELLRSLAMLYPDTGLERRSHGMSRYFLKVFFRKFPGEGIAEYLDELTYDIQCRCSPKRVYSCECRYGISKIVGGLLDRYFEVENGQYDPARVWNWTKNLRFPRPIRMEDSASTRVLSENHALRQEIHKIALSGSTTIEECNEIQRQFYFSHAHAGLRFKANDIGIIVKRAFEQNQVPLWESFWRPHNVWSEMKGPDDHRAKMRGQAREEPEFMRVWARCNSAAKRLARENRRHWANRSKRYALQEAEAKVRNLEHLRDNRAQIERGQHWHWLETFAYHYIHEPEKFDEIVDDMDTVHCALRNCFPFLANHVPTLNDLSRRKGTNIAAVLHAASVLRWREAGALDDIEVKILRVVKTESGSSEGVSVEEAQAFDAELNRLLFNGKAEIEQFARDYIEPSLSLSDNAPTNVDWLERKSPFEALRATLPLEWLQRFPNMPRHAETYLFKMAVRYAPSADVRGLIAARVQQYLPEPIPGSSQSTHDRRNYWLMNCFFHDNDDRVWNILQADKNTLLRIAARSDIFTDNDEMKALSLSADKYYKILDAFVEEWTKVELPSIYGTGDPPDEAAYRFMREIPWRIGRDQPKKALVVLDKLLGDTRFTDYRNDLLTVRAEVVRKEAHRDYRAPSPAEVSALLEKRSVASVEDMRAFIVETLTEIESQIRQAETDTLNTFYSNGKHVDENTARNRLVEALRGYMTANRLSVVIEHHLAQGKRCDFTVTEMIEGRRRLLTIEVKGQWHPALFTAAAEQLATRYSSNPDAEQQGIYLVLWFGPSEKVAGRKNTAYKTPEELRMAIIESMPLELQARIDVQVINLSRSS